MRFRHFFANLKFDHFLVIVPLRDSVRTEQTLEQDIILMSNPSIYSPADVISTYVYRQGLVKFNYSYSSAIGLMNSVFNIILLLIANKIAKTVTETSLL